MKTLKVPFLPELDKLELKSLGEIMTEKACHDRIAINDWQNQFPYTPKVSFDVARSESRFYIRYNVEGNSLKALYDKDGSPVHLDSCVEFFMQIPGDEHYRNFEFNCIGCSEASIRLSRDIKEDLTENEYKSILRFPSLKKETFAERLGVFSWNILISIPFEVMGLNPKALPEKIFGNFYKCADDTKDPHFLSWSPIDLPNPDFHCPKFFGTINL